MPGGEFDQRPVGRHSGCDIDEVDLLARQHLGCVRVGCRNLEVLGHRACLRAVAVADGNNLGAIEADPAMHVIARKEAAPNQRASPDAVRHVAPPQSLV